MARAQKCDRKDASTRLAHARKFLEVAEIVPDGQILESGSVAAALALLAGIAASDAACCVALGRRSRGEDHHDAEGLLTQVVPGGADAAEALRRLLDLKDTAQYGLTNISGAKLKTAMRRATKLVEFAAAVFAR